MLLIVVFAWTNPGVQLFYWSDLRIFWLLMGCIGDLLTGWKVSRFSDVMNSSRFASVSASRGGAVPFMYAAGPTILGHAHSKMCCGAHGGSGHNGQQNDGVPLGCRPGVTSNSISWELGPYSYGEIQAASPKSAVQFPPSWYYVGSSQLAWWMFMAFTTWPTAGTAPYCTEAHCRSGGRRCRLCHPFGCRTQGTGATARVGAPCPKKVWTLAGTGGMC